MSHQFFANKPIDVLLGAELKAEDITDYTLGHALDEIYRYGSSSLFADIGFAVALEHNLLSSNIHLDTTSISVDGDYSNQNTGEAKVINITHGYSKDMRSDLKQFVLSLAVSGASNLPLFMEVLDGNSSDKSSFDETVRKVEEFKAQIDLQHDFKWVADSALYTADKLLQSKHLWLTRVPENIKEASELVWRADNNIAWEVYNDAYKFAAYDSTYGGMTQRWLLVFSSHAYEREKKTLEKQLVKKDGELEKALWHLGNEIFACEKDAKSALNRLAKKFKLHAVSGDAEAIYKYSKPGKPKEAETKILTGYKLIATFRRNSELIEQIQNSKGRFILASNDLDKEAYPNTAMLKEYKEQQGVEGGFRFIKDPWFMVNSVFLKSPKRIEALMMVMTLCLLVYNVSTMSNQTQTLDLRVQLDKEMFGLPKYDSISSPKFAHVVPLTARKEFAAGWAYYGLSKIIYKDRIRDRSTLINTIDSFGHHKFIGLAKDDNDIKTAINSKKDYRLEAQIFGSKIFPMQTSR